MSLASSVLRVTGRYSFRFWQIWDYHRVLHFIYIYFIGLNCMWTEHKPYPKSEIKIMNGGNASSPWSGCLFRTKSNTNQFFLPHLSGCQVMVWMLIFQRDHKQRFCVHHASITHGKILQKNVFSHVTDLQTGKKGWNLAGAACCQTDNPAGHRSTTEDTFCHVHHWWSLVWTRLVAGLVSVRSPVLLAHFSLVSPMF